MKDFHSFVKKLLMGWVLVYMGLLLPGLGRGIFLYVISDFTMPTKHYFAIISTIYQGALWLVPTAFLLVAYYLSRPNRRYLQG
ncbi:MAG: hypothetical protein K0Q50_2864 [Vampirovibrio sp.]|jgi:hypothetical protein|nr:hypothetical protein [Vampirovibrio sp.]